MFLNRSRIWRFVLFAGVVSCGILGRVYGEQRVRFFTAGGIFVFVIIVLWYADNRRDRSA